MNRSLKTLILILLLLMSMALFSACGSDADPAAQAVESYLEALAEKDAAGVVSFSCAAWEQSATLEVDSLQTVGTELVDLACTQSGEDGETALVACEGKLVLTYNGEPRDLDFSRRTYEVVQEGGDWRVCGFR